MTRVAAGLICLVLTATGCGGGEDITWDLSEPSKGTDLGALSPQLVEVDGPDPITVKFPSGRIVEFADFDVAQAVLGPGPGAPSDFLDLVRVATSKAPEAEELTDFASAFTEEWGTATDADGVTLDEFVNDAALDDFIEENAERSFPQESRVFVGDPEDGITPSFDISSGPAWLVIALFDFEP